MSEHKFIDLDRIICRAADTRQRRGMMHLVTSPATASPRPKVEAKYPSYILEALREIGPAAVSELHVAPEWRAGTPEPMSDEMMFYGLRHLLRAGLVTRTDEVIEAGNIIAIKYVAAVRVRHRTRIRPAG